MGIVILVVVALLWGEMHSRVSVCAPPSAAFVSIEHCRESSTREAWRD